MSHRPVQFQSSLILSPPPPPSPPPSPSFSPHVTPGQSSSSPVLFYPLLSTPLPPSLSPSVTPGQSSSSPALFYPLPPPVFGGKGGRGLYRRARRCQTNAVFPTFLLPAHKTLGLSEAGQMPFFLSSFQSMVLAILGLNASHGLCLVSRKGRNILQASGI